MRRVRHFVLSLAVVLAPLAWSASPEPVRGKAGMVASRSPLASEVGAAMLARGGNAVDAAVATGFALAVTYPSAGNVGGGGFMVIRLADGQVIANDHRERAPAKAHRDLYLDEAGDVIEGLSTDSHLAVGVPGTVAGLLDVQERYGALDLPTVIDPAIRLAREGFALPADVARQLAGQWDRLARHEATAAKFAGEDGAPLAAGTHFAQPDLAATLERIRKLGRAGFYAGETADLLVAEMERDGGLISHEDLAAYRSVWREPVRGSYRGHDIVSMPPPSSGGVLLVQLLNLLEPIDVGALGFGSAALVHRIVEAERRAYADRAQHLGDPDFHPVPLATLVDKAYAARRFRDFDPRQASRSKAIFAGDIPQESPDTTHVSVMDAAGNAVAYTTTLNFSHGAKIVVPGAGFLLNNEMDDFAAKPNAPNAYGLLGGDANAIAPGKRMLSSMSPTIVLRDGAPLLVTGSPGGSTIITTVMQVIVNVIDHGMSLSEAVSAPRFHHQWQPDQITVERFGWSPDTRAKLEALGHRNIVTVPLGRGIGDANSVMRVEGGFVGMADPRGAGAATGV